jgi:nucleoside-diphosphate-sugar epimerase
MDPYGVSKHKAELGLRQLSRETEMEVVVIRPPLVYGPDVKANFLSMMNWLAQEIPLPLGDLTNNLRSYIYIDNLVDLIIRCINHPAAVNQTFFASDDEDLSTTELLERMAAALNVKAKLIKVPEALIKFGAILVGKPEISQRLCSSLQVDISKTKEFLDWAPLIRVNEGLGRTAASFLRDKT